MITINLLPPEMRGRRIRLRRIVIMVYCLVFLLCGSVYGYGLYAELQLRAELQEMQNRYELLRPTLDRMKAAQQQQQQISGKSAILLNLTRERQSWHAVLAHIGVLTPSTVWLTEMEGGNKHIVLKGMAVSYPDVAAFLEKLAGDTFFAEPVLIRTDRDEELNVTRFELTVKIKGM